MIRSTFAVFALAACAALPACSTNPTTGRSQFSVLSREDEVAIGATEGPKLTQEFGGEVQNAALREYINEVGMRLKEQTEADGPQRKWTFTLLDSDVINAFALPGEAVFMSRGLADKMTNEAQLAGVLGHEIGHVMARHSADRISQAMVGQGILTVGGLFAGGSSGGQLAVQGGQLLIGGTLLKFSRDQESEADSLGMRYMTKAGYNPRGQLAVMQILERESKGGGTIELLATHPLPSTRIERVKDLLKTEYAATQAGPDAQRYQFFPERFQQRYLSIRAAEPNPPGAAAKRRAMSEYGHVNFDDPTSWCSVCAARAAMAGR